MLTRGLLVAVFGSSCFDTSLLATDAVETADVPDAPREVPDAPGKVIVLTQGNFDEMLKKHKRVLIDFYAPWCGHCKALEPEYNSAAETMHAEGLMTRLAKIDATKESELGQQHDVTGYPTIYYFVDGEKSTKYEADRTAASIVEWLRNKEVSLIKEIKHSEVDAFHNKVLEELDKDSIEFIVYAYVKEKSAREKAFRGAVDTDINEWIPRAKRYWKFRAYVVYLPKSADPKKDAKLVMHRLGFQDPDPVQLEYPGAWSDLSLAKWMKTSTYASLGKSYYADYTWAAVDALSWTGIVTVCLDDKAAGEDDDLLKPEVNTLLRPLIVKYPKWKFTLCELSALQDSDRDTLGARKGSEPLVSVRLGSRKKYVLETDKLAKPDVISNFLAEVSANKVKPHYKSSAKPTSEKDEGVVVLTGDTFEEVAFNSKKDVFVEFYAPWCGHCKKLVPVWSDLAKQIAANGWDKKGVVIAKMDSTENDSEEEVTGFPLLVLYPAVKKDKKMSKKLVYSGSRDDAEPLVDFLMENAKNLDGVEAPLAGTGKKHLSMTDRERAKRRKEL